LSKKQWGQPELDWLPMSRAVFTFGVAEEGISDALHDKPLHELTEAEMAETHATSFSVRVLTRMLEEKTGARKAEINPTSCTFSFSFDIDGVASLMSGPPWAIIEEPRETAASFDPRLDAEALFNTEGFVRIGDEEAVSHAEQLDAVRKATGLVWRQFMLRAFDRAVSTGAVVLFARIQATSSPFDNPKDLDRLFDAFFTTKPDGLGMGLRICRTIIADHGGNLWASRNADTGATFKFSLPMQPRRA
jgi:hypothetical protein